MVEKFDSVQAHSKLDQDQDVFFIWDQFQVDLARFLKIFLCRIKFIIQFIGPS